MRYLKIIGFIPVILLLLIMMVSSRLLIEKKEMVLVSGFNVFPNEVENVISSHPKVLEVGVIGVSDEKTTEAVKAVIVKKDESLTSEEIKKY